MSDTAVTAATSTASQADSVSAYSNNTLDQDAFLTLFTTQLQYQDPMNPMESYEMASQLAQFSSVQELSELNDKVLEVESYLSSINNAQMIETIGKEVVGALDTLQLENGGTSELSYELEEPCDVTVNIYDEDDHLVRSLEMGAQEAGSHQVQWDGRDGSGQLLEDGTYTVEIEAVDEGGSDVDVSTTVTGTVYSFRIEEGMPYLILNGEDGVRLPIGSIQEVRDVSEQTAEENGLAMPDMEDLGDQFSVSNLLSLGGVLLSLV